MIGVIPPIWPTSPEPDLRTIILATHTRLPGSTFGVVDPYRNAWILSDRNGWGYSLDDIEEWLAGRSG